MTELRSGNVVTLEANPGVSRLILLPEAKRLSVRSGFNRVPLSAKAHVLKIKRRRFFRRVAFDACERCAQRHCGYLLLHVVNWFFSQRTVTTVVVINAY